MEDDNEVIIQVGVWVSKEDVEQVQAGLISGYRELVVSAINSDSYEITTIEGRRP